MNHDCQDLIRLFNACFSGDYNTVLVGGAAEPEYLPADENHTHHRIIFTRDYFRSALHEVAHWCVAGAERRLQPDFGYWYAPDGRNAEQQGAFEQVEIKPQALEQLFCEAAGHRFSVSTDNLGGEQTDPAPFRLAVQSQRDRYLAEGLAERPARFIRALGDFYRSGVLPHEHAEPYAGAPLQPGTTPVCA